jgi:hypothetical protein
MCNRWLVCILAALPLAGTTLKLLTMDDIVSQATSIVRGRIDSCTGERRGDVIYTRCQMNVTETWKGSPATASDVYIPGGTAQGRTQTFAGSPALGAGQEYVLFLWAGKSGINQVIGLTQGVFQLSQSDKTTMAVRAASTEPMVDAQGRPVHDASLRYSASELKRLVDGILTRSK